MKAPQIRYTRTCDGVRIAFTVYPGRGDPLLHLYAPCSPPLQMAHLIPSHTEWLRAITGDHPAVVFDYRGTGLSGPISGELSVDQVVADISAVTEAVGCDVDAIAYNTGCFGAVHYAATDARLWRTLTLSNPALSGRETMSRPLMSLLPSMPRMMFLETLLRTAWDALPGDVSLVARLWSEAVPEATALAYQKLLDELDLRELLPRIAIPTRVSASPYMHETSATVADLIHSATFVAHSVHVLMNRESGRLSRESLDQWYAAIGIPQPGRTSHPGLAPGNPIARLTGREEEVLRLVADGLSNAEVAAVLRMSVRTVERHTTNIYAKLRVNNRVAAANWALRNDRG